MDELGPSARAHDRILRVARTIADVEGGGPIRPAHVVEAISYRSLDRKLWARQPKKYKQEGYSTLNPQGLLVSVPALRPLAWRAGAADAMLLQDVTRAREGP